MNDVLKQRLVGALVIIVTGAIFWPLVFSDPNQLSLDRTTQVPPVPELKKLQLEPPQPIADVEPAGGRYDALLVAEAEQLEKAAQVAEPQVTSESTSGSVEEAAVASVAEQEKPSLDERSIPIAWVLRVITVSKKDKAEQLVKELVDSGHKAYFRPITRNSETLYRVNIGPRFERKAIENLKSEVDKELQVNSIITRYVP